MKYIGNYKDWIKKEWVDYLLNNNGTPRPSTTKENPDTEEFRLASKVGYNLSQTWWYHYTDTSCPLKIEIPFDLDKPHIWWFIKLLPGGQMPMHRDPHTTHHMFKNTQRYWMPLQDYVPGHIFVYNNIFMTDYRAGDLWTYENSNEIHGCCNISYVPRLTFQFSTYDS